MSVFNRFDEEFPSADFRREKFTKEEMLEIIDAYLNQKPELVKGSRREPGYCIIIAINYLVYYRMMREKYAKRWSIDLSKEKLTFSEVMIFFTFIERAARHCGDYSPDDYEKWLNLLSRLEEIRDELLEDDYSDQYFSSGLPKE